ncbi:hypothetical protein [Commensalibacter communis]|uniref:hypothetical protein n=1 Tax=Commensalibacter communis TaxID=2972786 RepID=UPI0022FFB9B4|nr:hypothetical protein [Commensalibacter communis]CAI3951644.1 unnamed protein product [Commensalibacter communis]CAI3954000.1 unnamed protein product [Commensalibacter communis]
MSAREKTFSEELNKLIEEGNLLLLGILYQKDPKRIQGLFNEQNQEKYNNIIKSLHDFKNKYESWYSKSSKVIKTILPDRLTDFTSAYKKPSRHKELTIVNYTIQDFIIGININKTDSIDLVANLYLQQLSILKATKEMLSSTLLDLKALVQADSFDSEIDIAKELAKKRFFRAAGAICGVIIAKHLLTLCQNHNIEIDKKHPTISDLCEPLKKEEIISQPDWRSIQFCADIRNLCCHNKEQEPTEEQVDDLIDGTDKIIKTIS